MAINSKVCSASLCDSTSFDLQSLTKAVTSHKNTTDNYLHNHNKDRDLRRSYPK